MKSTGRHPYNALSAVFVRNVKNSGMYADGNGLYLRVDESGARRWVQRIVIRGRRRNLGLGGWPLVSLKEAREKAAVSVDANEIWQIEMAFIFSSGSAPDIKW